MYSNENKMLIALLLLAYTSQAKYWLYAMPKTEQGGQYYKMCELYFAQNDMPNLLLSAKKGREVEPEAFYFADRVAQSQYETSKGSEALKLSDSLIKSDYATAYSFATNAWIHEWIRDFNNATIAFKTGLSKFPNDLDLKEKASSYFQDRKNWSEFLEVADKILEINPYHETIHYDLFLYYDKQKNLSKTLLHGETTMLLSPFSVDNLTIKNKLFDVYTKIANEHVAKKSQKLTFLDDMYQGATKDFVNFNSIADIIYFQTVVQYNYSLFADKDKKENILYQNLFDYKKKLMDAGHWETCWSWAYGNTKFPDQYKTFIESNATKLSDFMNWLNDNKLEK